MGGPTPIFVHSWWQVAYYDDSRILHIIVPVLRFHPPGLTLKQTQREKGSVMMTTNQEMEVRSQPHIPMPGSGSSPVMAPDMAGSSWR